MITRIKCKTIYDGVHKKYIFSQSCEGSGLHIESYFEAILKNLFKRHMLYTELTLSLNGICNPGRGRKDSERETRNMRQTAY